MTNKEPRGKLIFHDEVKKYTNDGKVKSAEEMFVHHSEDGYYTKYFKKNGSASTKIEVKAPAAGGEYTLMVTENGDKKTSTHSKSEILAYLKKNKALEFMLEYINRTKSLARAKKGSKKSKSKKGSKKSKKSKRSKKGSKKGSKKSKSKNGSKKSKSKRSKRSKKSKSKSRKARRAARRANRSHSRPKARKSKKSRKSKSKSKSRKPHKKARRSKSRSRK